MPGKHNAQHTLTSYVTEIINKVFEEAKIERFIERKIRVEENTIIISESARVRIGKRRIWLLGVGKAAEGMTRSIMRLLGEKVEGGLLVLPKEAPTPRFPNSIKVIHAGHPLPDEDSLRAGEEALKLASSLGERDLLITLVSGGGSALLEKPVEGVKLVELRRLTKLLLDSGASIREVNIVRKHLSRIKGGWLAKKAYPARVLALLASDVPGDDPSLIASGPTVPDPSTYVEALEILRFYGLAEKVPESILDVLKRGVRGELPETPKPGDICFETVTNTVIATPAELLSRIAGFAEKIGYKPHILTSRLEGESRDVAKTLASIVLDSIDGKTSIKTPASLLAAGETSVTVRGGGWGGRNTELVAWLSKHLYQQRPLAFASIDTDGIDGNTPCAGAWGDHETWGRILRVFSRKALEHLYQNNTYVLLERIGQTINTGFTGTNLNSVTIILF